MSFLSTPGTYEEANTNPVECRVIDEEMSILTSKETWELIDPPTGADVVACK